MTESCGTDVDGLCPTETEHEKHKKTDGVDVIERVKAQPALRFRGLVSAQACNRRVRKFVKRQRNNNGNKSKDNGLQNRDGVGTSDKVVYCVNKHIYSPVKCFFS